MDLIRSTRGCPSCGLLVRKEGGCNKVICPGCGAWFCWLCGAHIETGADYVREGHFFSGRCAGQLFASNEAALAPVTKEELARFRERG